MGRFVIVAYAPKPGMDETLRSLLARHRQVLQAEGLVTERSAYLMRSRSGALLEVFEWRSAEAIEAAHTRPAVQALWAEFDAACQYAPLASIEEAAQPFAEFEPLG